MTVYSEQTNRALKHYAADASNSTKRYIVIILENEDNRDNCTVVDYDKMTPQMRSEFIDFINSDTCQRSMEVWKELDKKFFLDYPQMSMFNIIKRLNLMEVLPSERVLIQCPNNQTMTPKALADAVRAYTKEKEKKASGITNEDKLDVKLAKEAADKNSVDIETLRKDMDTIKGQLSDLMTVVTKLVKQKR